MRNLFLIVFLFFMHRVAAEKVHIDATPAWLYKNSVNPVKAPAAKTISNGYYIELLDHQVNLINSTEYTHIIKHIVNETGIQNESEVSVSFSPDYQQVVFHQISLIRGGVVVNQLSSARIKIVQEETEASDFQYNGLRRAYISLTDVQKGDRIEAAYSVTGFNPVFAGRYSDKLYFSSSTAICNYYETIIAPGNRKLNIHTYNHAVVPQEIHEKDLLIYNWNNPTLKLNESPDYVPSWFDDLPSVSVTAFNSWEEVIAWGLAVFKNYQYPLPEELKRRIAGWQLAAKGDKDAFITQAIRFVQDQVRYLGLELGTYTHQPHSPAEVYRQRYGDCKDKALLLTAILQQQGIGACVALVKVPVPA